MIPRSRLKLFGNARRSTLSIVDIAGLRSPPEALRKREAFNANDLTHS